MRKVFSENFTKNLINSIIAVGLYELSFHNCFNRNNEILAIDTLSMKLVEMNGEHYLSTGEIPLPMVNYFPAQIYFLIEMFLGLWRGVVSFLLGHFCLARCPPA